MSKTKKASIETLPTRTSDLKTLVQSRARSAVLSAPADIDVMMKAGSTTLVDPGVPFGDYVDGERRKTGKAPARDKAGNNAVPPKLFHSFIDGEVGYMLKEEAARRRMSPRALLEEIVRQACQAERRERGGQTGK